MLSTFEWWHGAFLLLAVVLEILANILLKMSNGFKRLWLGILSLLAEGGFTRILVVDGRFWYIFEKKSALFMIKNTRNGDRRAGFW